MLYGKEFIKKRREVNIFNNLEKAVQFFNLSVF
jgi:hypothetical protein